jgi:hypothetical protein
VPAGLLGVGDHVLALLAKALNPKLDDISGLQVMWWLLA